MPRDIYCEVSFYTKMEGIILSNNNLKAARKAKNDEFYTQLSDIEKELRHYSDKFSGKTVYSNCDNPRFSNFVRYFIMNFSFLKIDKFIATYYNQDGCGGKLVVTANNIDSFLVNGDYKQSVINDNIQELSGDGDFRSDECVELLKESDIVVTNPPFSLFREFVNLILNNKLLGDSKQLITVGNSNAITYKDMWPLLKSNRLWLGYNSVKLFEIPKSTANDKSEYLNGKYYAKMGNICWFTNVDTARRYKPIDLYCNYTGNENSYPKYDNYNAINVDKVSEIPVDYAGVMGVPITFLDKWDPEQFEIIGLGNGESLFTPSKHYPGAILHYPNGNILNGESILGRVLAIKHEGTPPNKAYYTADNVTGWLSSPYTRMLIKRIDFTKNE